MDKKDSKQGYMQLQLIMNQLSQLQEQFRMIDAQILELGSIRNSVDELQDIKKGSEILAPISTGIFVKSELKNNKNFIVNIGGGITVSKDQDQLMEFLDRQLNEIRKVQTELLTRIQSLNLQSEYLKKEMSKFVN